MVEDDTDETGGYYVYIWPNDGTKWRGTEDDIAYDCWFENYQRLESNFKFRNWEIEWEEEEKDKSAIKDK